jgi:hypothetical protein
MKFEDLFSEEMIHFVNNLLKQEFYLLQLPFNALDSDICTTYYLLIENKDFYKWLKNLVSFSGVYGDVMRVKILFNKKDTALVQMSEPRGAQLGRSHR